MSDILKEISRIELEISDLNDKKNKLVTEHIENVKSNEAIDIIKKITWSYFPKLDTHVGNYNIKPYDKKSKELFADLLDLLCLDDWHHKEAFYNGRANILVNDSFEEIVFHNEEDVISFVSEYNLNIDISEFNEYMSDKVKDLIKLKVKANKLLNSSKSKK